MTFPYKGYAGYYLDVDLTKGKLHKKELEKDWARLYLGGSGVAARILWDRTGPETDPLGPENVLVLGTGPLTGALFSPSGRMMFASKGPLTGVWAESHVGGFLDSEANWGYPRSGVIFWPNPKSSMPSLSWWPWPFLLPKYIEHSRSLDRRSTSPYPPRQSLRFLGVLPPFLLALPTSSVGRNMSSYCFTPGLTSFAKAGEGNSL